MFMTNRLADQIAEMEAKQLAEYPPIAEPAEQPQAAQGPRYVFYRPWYERFLAKGCKRCGGDPQGWLQTQIQTPYRFKRFVLWIVNLLPRGVSMIRVVTSKRVSSEQYAERQAACGECPSAVIQLRVRRGKVSETSYCGACDCPKWRGSRNAVRNKRSAWRCPAKLHAGSDRDAVFGEYVRAKAAQENGRGGLLDG
jgi:hypothetical protein